MKISLRKAKVVQTNILECIESIRYVLSVEINEFQDVNALMQQAYNNTIAADKRRNDLTAAIYEIRDLVGAANASSGIDTLLTQIAYIDRRVKQVTELSNATEVLPPEVLAGRVERLKFEKESIGSYRSGSTSYTGIFTREQLTQFKAEITQLKRQRQRLNDRLLHLNMTTEISLKDETVNLLKGEDIL
jgi:hypothetical protein